MPKGVKIKSEIPGDGREACRGDVVIVNLRIFLNKGDEVTAEYPDSPRSVIDLGRREIIAGIRYGIEGMHAGGKRTLIVSPYLAYGEEGLGEWIPPHAVLRCEVELLEVHDAGYIEPAAHHGRDSISVFIPGSIVDAKVRCQVALGTEGNTGALITRPRPDGSWRRCSQFSVSHTVNQERYEQLVEELRTLPVQHPDECLAHDELWSDHSEPANGITRDQKTDTACITFSFGDYCSRELYFSVKSTSRVWRDSAIRAEIVNLLENHLGSDEIY